jgi:hypothetical protein
MSMLSSGLLVSVVASTLTVTSCGSDEPNVADADASVVVEQGTLDIYPRALYSAYIEGSGQQFQVPAIVAGFPAESWECDDPDAVNLETGAVPNGVMITTRKAGTFKIRASSGSRFGEVELVVSEATAAQLEDGLFRYNQMVTRDFEGRNIAGLAPQMAACSTCHGGRTGWTIEYTPQQIGGYSDDELKAIFALGVRLPGAQLGSFPEIEMFFPLMHRSEGGVQDFQSLVIYMRSFKPVSQAGLDFVTM